MTDSEPDDVGTLSRAEALAEVAKLDRTIDLIQFTMVHTMLDMYRRGEPVPDFSAATDNRGRRRRINARS